MAPEPVQPAPWAEGETLCFLSLFHLAAIRKARENGAGMAACVTGPVR